MRQTQSLKDYFVGNQVKGALHPKPKISMFCALYLKIINTFFEKNNICIYSKLSKELKNGIEISVGQSVFKIMDQNSQNVIWINNSWTVWPT